MNVDDVWLQLTEKAIGLAPKGEWVHVSKRLVSGEAVALQAVNDDRGAIVILSEVSVNL